MKQGLCYHAERELNVVIELSQARLEVGTDDKNWKNQKKKPKNKKPEKKNHFQNRMPQRFPSII